MKDDTRVAQTVERHPNPVEVASDDRSSLVAESRPVNSSPTIPKVQVPPRVPLSKHHKWHLFEWNRRIGTFDPDLGDDGEIDIYMQRWMLDCWFFSIRLHKFHRSDDDRALHDHPWSFATLVLSGGYWDVTHDQRGYVDAEWVGPGRVRYRPLGHRHTVKLKKRNGAEIPSWSIVITGRYKHRWGFYVKNMLGEERFVNSQRYFREFGHH